MDDIDALTPKEKSQKTTAVTTLLATTFPHLFLKEGRAKAADKLKRRQKTKADYNKERKRDFRYGKATGEIKADEVADQIERDGIVSYAALGAAIDDPYFRNFDGGHLKETVRNLHPKFHTFEKVRVIDIAGQRVGNDGLEMLLGNMDRCPVEVLGLTDNLIDDTGLEILSRKIRSFSMLRELYLNQNRFRDFGVQALFGKDSYSPTLEIINLARNTLGLRTAYFLGLMFTKEREAKLHTLILGGRIGRHGFGDEFIRCLASFFALPGSRSPLKLAIPEAEIGQPGLLSICLAITCSPALRELNIERNALGSSNIHNVLTTALTLHTGIKLVHDFQAGLTRLDRHKVQESLTRKVRPDWRQLTTLAAYLAKETFDSRLVRLSLQRDVFNDHRGIVAPWPKDFRGDAPTLPIPTPETCRPQQELYQILIDSRMVLSQPQLVSFLPSLPPLIQTETKGLIRNLNKTAYLSFVLWEMVDEDVKLSGIRGLKPLINHYLERKKVMSVIIDSTITELDKFASIAKAKKRKAKGKGRSKGFANSMDGILMSLQDCADQLRLCSSDVEKLIGFVHKSIREERGLSKQLDLADEARDLLPYACMGPSAFFVHYIFVARPFEIHVRKKKEEQKKIQLALEKKIAEKNARKNRGKKVLGKRLVIEDGAGLRDERYWARLAGYEHLVNDGGEPVGMDEDVEVLGGDPLVPPTVFRWADVFGPDAVKPEESVSLTDFTSIDDAQKSVDEGPILNSLFRIGRNTLQKYYVEDSMMVQRMFLHGRYAKKYHVHRRPVASFHFEVEEVRSETAISITRSHVSRAVMRIEDNLRDILSCRQDDRAKEMQV
jgi:hypothetical protein